MLSHVNCTYLYASYLPGARYAFLMYDFNFIVDILLRSYSVQEAAGSHISEH